MAEEQKKKDSSVDKINNVAQKGRSAYNTYKNAKRVYNAARVARAGWTAAQGTLALTTTPVGWIALGICLVLIVAVLIISLSGGVSNVKAGDLTNNTSPVPSGEFFSPGPSSSGVPVDPNSISSYVNIKNATASQTQQIYDILAIPFRSPRYKELFTKGGKVNIVVLSAGGACMGGHVDDRNTITLEGSFNCNTPTLKYFLIHETGHIIGWRNNLPYDRNTLMKGDPSCYVNGYLKSYPWNTSRAGTANNESFAETVSAYVLYNSPGRYYVDGAVPITDYPTRCSNTYKWAFSNIFGGVEFPQPQ